MEYDAKLAQEAYETLRSESRKGISLSEEELAYLDSVSLQKGSREFDIPFDRQQLADYLNVERTALSKELRKMSDDGLIEFDRSHFRLL